MVLWSVFVDFVHLTALLPFELCTSYVSKFHILRALGLPINLTFKITLANSASIAWVCFDSSVPRFVSTEVNLC